MSLKVILASGLQDHTIPRSRKPKLPVEFRCRWYLKMYSRSTWPVAPPPSLCRISTQSIVGRYQTAFDRLRLSDLVSNLLDVAVHPPLKSLCVPLLLLCELLRRRAFAISDFPLLIFYLFLRVFGSLPNERPIACCFAWCLVSPSTA